MRGLNVSQEIKSFMEAKRAAVNARLFVGREDGLTVYDTVQNETTSSVAALVSGVWQASEALMGMVDRDRGVVDFRLGFDTSSQGVFLLPFHLQGKRYFLGAIYQDYLNPGQLKRQVAQLKVELDLAFQAYSADFKTTASESAQREGFLFTDISDEEIDRLFSIGGH
jgi:hypothetical protein